MLRRGMVRTAMTLALAGGLTALAVRPALALSSAPDQTWRTNGKVYALARWGNTLFVGGRFTRVVSPDGTQKQKVGNLAAFDMTTGAWIPTFAPTVANTLTTALPQVRALEVSADGSTLYVGGRFDTVDGTSVSNLAAVDTSAGQVSAGFVAPPVNRAVNAILAGPSLVYLGGAFTRVDGRPRSYLAALAFDGTLDANWVPSANDTVRSLTFAADGTIFVGGKYTTMDGQPRASVARVSADTGALAAWAVPQGVIDAGVPAWDMVATSTRLFVGFGSGPNYLAAFRLDDSDRGSQVWRYNTVGNVESVALSPDGNRLFFGGHFGTAVLQQQVCGNQYLRGLASVDPSNGQLRCDWLPQIEPHGANYKGAWALLGTSTQLWVGGYFTSISGVTQSGIARFTL